MVKTTEHPDVNYMASLMQGRNVVGEIGRSYLYPPDDKPNTMTLEEWTEAPAARNKAVLRNIKPTGDDDLDRLSWERR